MGLGGACGSARAGAGARARVFKGKGKGKGKGFEAAGSDKPTHTAGR